MKPLVKFVLLPGWIILASLGLTYLWGNNPDWFFSMPESMANWLVKAFGVTSQEGVAELELLYLSLSALITVLLVTFIVGILWARRKDPNEL